MPRTIQKAPGKIILFGEHAVVYGQPAIAVPIPQRYATATIEPIIRGDEPTRIIAPDIQMDIPIDDLPYEHPFVQITKLVKDLGKLHHLPAMKIHIHSTIPVSSGLGSGAAVSVALARALCTFLGIEHTNADISAMAYEAEKYHHGNPSGIDNTVIAYSRGIFYQREQPIKWITIGRPIDLLIVNSGEQKSTRIMVNQVAEKVAVNPEYYNQIILNVGSLVIQAKKILESGDIETLGKLMLKNHQYLQELHVSTSTLDQLVMLAMNAGAFGAKLSGAGGGGNMIILADHEQIPDIEHMIHQAGFSNTIHATIQ
jgi:mevalonate kinase